MTQQQVDDAGVQAVWNNFPVLHRELEPIRPYLDDPTVSEIAINRPGELFVERLAEATMQRVIDPLLSKRWIMNVATLVASATRQVVNESRPLLSASLPSGERIQCVLPPVAPQGGALSIRKHLVTDLTLDDYEKAGAFEETRMADQLRPTETEIQLLEALQNENLMAFLAQAVRDRVSILISGGTSSGKTSFLNALMKLIPPEERIITIEDAPELVTAKLNSLSLVTSKGGQSQARVDTQDLVEAALRMRPDRLLLGELRGDEADSFIQAINTGHPGSLTTIHANSAMAAYERLAFMVDKARPNLSHKTIIDYLKQTVPIVVHVARRANGRFAVHEVIYSKLGATE
jgi:type IV secretion system protein VirB11